MWNARSDDRCPASDAPSGVASLTIDAMQPWIDGSGYAGGGHLTLCIGRPDLLATGPLALGDDVAGSPVRVVEASALNLDRDYARDPSRRVLGTIAATGLCASGHPAGAFAHDVTATLPLTQTCGRDVSAVEATLAGRVTVTP